MQARRQIGLAAGALSASVATLLLVGHPASAGEPSAKGDRLVVSPVVSPVRGDLLDMKPATAVPASLSSAAAAAPLEAAPVVLSRGTAARRLIDVAVRDEGVWLNSFTTRSMPLEAPACAELSEEIVSGLPVSAVKRLADEDLMRQTRVCGVNGSLLVTCYGGSATVSLRPSMPADGCR